MSGGCHEPPSPATWRALSLWLLRWAMRSHLICMATKKPLLGVTVWLR